MTNRKQYVTINGKKLYLDEDGKPVTARGVHLHTDLIAVLDLEVETEAPAFEDHRIPPVKPPALAVGRQGRLLVFLIGHVLLDDREGRTADRGDEIRVCPERGQP